MGQSKRIQDELESNERFRAYVNQISTDVESRQKKMAEKLDKMQKDHYAAFPDKALLIEGRYSHLTTMSEWSLKSISAMIDRCSEALFGNKEPEGSKKEEVDKKVSASVGALRERQEFISNEAFYLIQSIVGKFSNSTSTSVEQKLDGKPIAPGMILLIGVENKVYPEDSSFIHDKIVQTIFVYKVYYSIKEGAAQSTLSDLEVYENQKVNYRRQIEQLGEAMDNLDVMSDDYDEQEIKLNERIERLMERLDKLNEKILKLSSAPRKNIRPFFQTRIK